MNFAELHQKLALSYPSKISIIYPNALNGNKLSYLFSDITSAETLEVTFMDGKMFTRECIDKKITETEVDTDVQALKELTHSYYFKPKS